MEIKELLLCSVISFLFIPLVIFLLLVVKLLLRLTIPSVQFVAGDHFQWRQGSPFLIDRRYSTSRSSRSLLDSCLQLISVRKYEEVMEKEEGLLAAADCSICLCSMEEGEEVGELNCKHLFHRECLEQWIEIECFRATCPLCRNSLLPYELKLKCEYMDDEEDTVSPLAAFAHCPWWIW